MTVDDLIDELHRAADRTSPLAPFDLDAVLAGGERRLRVRRRRRVTAGGVAALGVTAAVAGLAWWPEPYRVATPAATGTATPEVIVTPMTPEAQATLDQLSQVMSILDQPQRPEDILPSEVTDGVVTDPDPTPGPATDPARGLVNATSRYLGRFDDTSFWIVIQASGLVCEVTKRDGFDEFDGHASGGCTGPTDYVIDTLGRPVLIGPSGTSYDADGRRLDDYRDWVARLIPDDYVPAAGETEVWTFPSPNLAVAWYDEIPTTDPHWTEHNR